MDSNWPRQADPTKAQRKLWNRFITSSFLRHSSYWHNPPPVPVLVPSNLEENEAEQESLTLRGMIKQLPWTERRMVESMSQLADMEAVNAAFSSKKTITIASDGGLKGTNGTFGWVIAKKSTLLYQGYGPVDGSPDTSSSTRCELWGYASALLALVLLAFQRGESHCCRIRWVVDSRAAISCENRARERGNASGALQ